MVLSLSISKDQTSGCMIFNSFATVVAKLLNIIQPDVAVFGNKDYQQLQVIRTMVADLLIPVTIVGADTTRGAKWFSDE